MEIEFLTIERNEYLNDALKRKGFKNIPTNVILDKTLTGIGATYNEIIANRNSIIIEPNIPVITGKTKNHKANTLGVYEKCKESSIKSFLLNSKIKYKKLITTPEGFRKIRNVALKLDIDIYKNYFCLFDECEKITQDIEYRKSISQPIYDFFRFENKAFVSATPLALTHTELEQQGFKILKIKPLFDYKQDIELIATNNVYRSLERKLQELRSSLNICIFLNSTKGINQVVTGLSTNDYKIFCSEKSLKAIKALGLNNVFSDIDLPLAKYNLFTSRFYSAVDINLKANAPDIILLTNLHLAQHTAIDPLSEAIQIQGRFRKEIEGKKYNSLTHITNFMQYDVLTDEQIEKQIEENRITYEALKKRYVENEDIVRQKAIKIDLKSLSFNDLLDDSGEINSFAVNNLYNEERVKRYYTSSNLLVRAYEESKYFNVSFTELYTLEGEIQLQFHRKKTVKDSIKFIVDFLEQGVEVRLLKETVRQADDSDYYFLVDTVAKVYEFSGSCYFEKVNYSRKKVEAELVRIESEEKRFSLEILEEIISHFELGKRYEKNCLKNYIVETYSRYGVIFKVTQKTILDYFEAKPYNNDKPATLKLEAVNPRILLNTLFQ